MNNLLKKSIKEYKEAQSLVYKIQKFSNEIRVVSKKAIALLRRDNIEESKKAIEEAETLFRLINEITEKNKELENQSFYKEAVEEYIEAITFYNFVNDSKKEIPDLIKVEPEGIISGICDFTGELLRKAITIASPEKFEQLLSYEKVIEDIAEELTKIGFRGKLRQKYDEVERNLRRIEDIIYDIKLKK
jgi:predicted translin family RNA/ssDNA-binding protein